MQDAEVHHLKETTAASGAATEAATEAAQTEVAAATGDFDTSKEKSVLTHVKMVQVQEALS